MASLATSKIDILKQEVQHLISLELYDSADVVLSLFISSLSSGKDNKDASPIVLSDLHEYYGDVLFIKEYYARAIQQFQQAMTYRKANAKSFRSNNLIHTSEEASLSYKQAKCYLKMKDSSTALRELEVIPTRLRSPQINLCLGKLYRQSHLTKQAIVAYREVLKEAPLAIEAIEALAALGETAHETTGLVCDACRERPVEEVTSSGWLNDIINWHSNRRNCEFEKNDAAMRKLFVAFPRSVYLLTQLGCAAVDAGKYDDATIFYKQIRRLDNLSMESMDRFALMLHTNGDVAELAQLASDAFQASTNVPVGWIIAALYTDLENQQEKSMGFLEKAIQLDPKYALSYVIKGMLLFKHGHSKQATVAYYQANKLQKSLLSTSGMIDTLLETGRFGDAVNAAKEALLSMPRSSVAYVIMGRVLCRTPQGVEQGIKSLQKALKLNPANKQATRLLAEELAALKRPQEAIKWLEDTLNHVSCGHLRTQLAKLYAQQDRLNDAIDELHIAISLNPQDCTEAAQELTRIEGLLRGENPSPLAGEDDLGDQMDAIEQESGSRDHLHSSLLHSRLFSDNDTSGAGIDRALFADDDFASDSD